MFWKGEGFESQFGEGSLLYGILTAVVFKRLRGFLKFGGTNGILRKFRRLEMRI